MRMPLCPREEGDCDSGDKGGRERATRYIPNLKVLGQSIPEAKFHLIPKLPPPLLLVSGH